MYRRTQTGRYPNFGAVLRARPQAIARVRGSEAYPTLMGEIKFYQTAYGVVVATEILGLPHAEGTCQQPIFGFHLHEGETCEGGTGSDPFFNTRMHYNPKNCPHPYHAGDMPPLFGAEGYAFSVFLTSRFSVREIIGKTAVIHRDPDDFRTQPSGDAGTKIACGEIVGV